MTPADKLDDALRTFATDSGDGFGGKNWPAAYDYRDEGYEIALQAYHLDDEEREAFVEDKVEAFDDDAQYLVSCAVAFRLAELGRPDMARAA